MMRLCLLPTVAVLTLAATAPATAQCEFEITGTATGADNVQLAFLFAPPPSCTTFFDWTFTVSWCTSPVPCAPGDSAAKLATDLVAAVNVAVSGCGGTNPGFSATLSGTTVTVTGPGASNCALVTDDIFDCVAATGGLPLGGCTINNVCNGVTCDENMPQVSGFQFAPASSCPDTIYCTPADGCGGNAAQCAFNTAMIGISGCDVSAGSIIVTFDQDPAMFIDMGFAGYLNVSAGGMGTTTNPISDGVLCIVGGGAIGRYNGPDTKVIDAAGHMQLDILNSQKTGGCDIPLITSTTGMNYCNSPGTTWTMQWWFRRSMMNPVSTLSGFSQAMAVTIN